MDGKITCYDIWSLIITALGTIATFLAVIVALWQTKYSNRKKLKLSISTVAQVTQDLATLKIDGNVFFLLSVSVVNIGNRKVVIKDWGFQFDKENALQIVSNNSKQPVIPCVVDTEESLFLQTDLLSIRKALIQHKSHIGRTDKKLCVYVMDSTGKKYYIKSKDEISYYMNLKDEDVRKTIN